MPCIRYEERKFRDQDLIAIERANGVLYDFAARGYTLTLRQLYYQHVARGWIPNNDREYKRLGNLIANARLAGLIDWNAIVDRTRNIESNQHWNHPADVVRSAAQSFALDKWRNQTYRLECWVEKDALVDVVGRACIGLDVPYFSCRGYTSLSELWGASQRILGYLEEGKTPIVLHLGDHDPSGLDMSQNLLRRLSQFCGQSIKIRRIALNWTQIQRYQPPPNPAKTTDSRFNWYVEEYGTDESWELDALDPDVITKLIESNILALRDEAAWQELVEIEEQGQNNLASVADQWNRLVEKAEQGDVL